MVKVPAHWFCCAIRLRIERNTKRIISRKYPKKKRENKQTNKQTNTPNANFCTFFSPSSIDVVDLRRINTTARKHCLDVSPSRLVFVLKNNWTSSSQLGLVEGVSPRQLTLLPVRHKLNSRKTEVQLSFQQGGSSSTFRKNEFNFFFWLQKCFLCVFSCDIAVSIPFPPYTTQHKPPLRS